MIDSHRDEIAKLESLYAMNPEGRVFTHLAEACRKAGQLDRARQILEEGLQKHPDYASAHVVLGRVLADSGEDRSAVTEFRRVLELDRHNLVALRSLGELATRAGNTREAIHYYNELAILDPTDVGIREQLRELNEQSTGTAAALEPIGEPDLEPGMPGSGAGTTDGPADEPGAEQAPIEVESHRSEEAGDGAGYAPLAGFETTAVEHEEPEATSQDDDPGTSWPALEPEAGMEPVQPGEAPPLDQEAWKEIASLGMEPDAEPDTAEPSAAAEDTADVEAGSADADIPGPSAEAEGTDSGEIAAEAGDIAAVAESSAPTIDEAGREASAVDAAAGDTGPEAESAGDAADRTAGVEVDGAADVEAAGAGPEPEAETSAPTIDEVHRRFMPPDDSAGASPDAEVEEGIEDEQDLDTEPGDDREIEGRWDQPKPLVTDVHAERSSPTIDGGEWIPADRWEWVAASADTPESESGMPQREPGADEAVDAMAADADVAAAGEVVGDRDIAADAADVEAGYDDETSFAGLVDEPVDSFEAGAAAVLDAFASENAEEETAEPARDVTAGPDADGSGSAGTLEPEEAADFEVTDSEDSGEEVITETLAEIYASQGLYDRATEVYRRLIERRPDDDRLKARLADLESATGWEAESASRAADEERDAFLERVESAWTGGGGAAGAMDESPYAWAEPESADPDDGPRIGDYFESLLAWQPVQAGPPVAAETAVPEGPESAGPGTAGPVVPEPAPGDDWYTEETEREAGEAGTGESGREGEEDLEMFRSWLKSLKK